MIAAPTPPDTSGLTAWHKRLVEYLHHTGRGDGAMAPCFVVTLVRSPMAASPHEITQLLHAWSNGEQSALDRLVPLVYDDLHRLARRRMAGERSDHTLQTTALVNEAYMRLTDAKQTDWKDRAHFFAVCAQVMRRILVDAARSRQALKRGADLTVMELDEAIAKAAEPAVDPIAMDMALDALAVFDPRKARVIELRIFGGLKVEEAAEVLKISTDTVTRDMHLATAWLRRELGREAPCGA
jgi:RNA polymerase sigma-70 factor, ECF subfamily